MPTIGSVPAIVSPTNLLPGQPVQSGSTAPQRSVAGNTNHAWGYYSPSLVTQPFSPPLAAENASLEDLAVFRVPASLDAREVELVVWARNTDVSNAATIRVELDTDGGYNTETVPPSTTTATQYAILVTLPTYADTLMLRSSGSTGLKIDSVALRWGTRGSDDFTTKPSGMEFTDLDAECGADDPLSDEMMNRWLRNPRRIWADRPGGVGQVVQGLLDGSLYTVGGSTRSGIARITTRIRYKCQVRWWALLTGPATGSACIITDDQQDDVVTLAPAPATSLPAIGGPYQWLSGTMDLEPGWHRFTVDLNSNGVADTTLWTLQGIVVPV